MITSSLTRAYWIEIAEKIARPVLTALSQGQLRATMPVEIAPHSSRIRVAPTVPK